jgi:hypothetical protein
MYSQIKQPLKISLPLVLTTILLSACGGAPADDSLGQPSSVVNKPEASISSSATSAGVSSSTAPSPLPPSSTTTSASNSTPTSSAKGNSGASRNSTSSSGKPPIVSDTTAPEATELLPYRLAETSVTLIWDGAVDNVSISHYEIERDGEVVATASYASRIFIDKGLVAGTDYAYQITAFDLSGNYSSSPVLKVTTIPVSNGGTKSASSASKVSASSKSSMRTSSKSSSSTSSITNSRSKSSSSSLSTSTLSSSSRSSTSSRASSRASSSSSLKSSSSTQETITITWNRPTTREDKIVFLDPNEIAGYEIRYRSSNAITYTSITLPGTLVEYVFEGDPTMEFEIAAFDTRGIYGDFTKISQ